MLTTSLTSLELDVDLVRSLLDPSVAPTRSHDRRKSPRWPFHVEQPIAAYYGNRLPAKADFQQVACHDLSTGGIAFYWPTLPDFENVVVGLGKPKHPIFLIAQVKFCRPLRLLSGEFLLGCQFKHRATCY